MAFPAGTDSQRAPTFFISNPILSNVSNIILSNLLHAMLPRDWITGGSRYCISLHIIKACVNGLCILYHKQNTMNTCMALMYLFFMAVFSVQNVEMHTA